MSAYIIAAVFLLLALLAGFLFISHSIEKRRVRRLRITTALKARRNGFRDLATSFPADFLPPDLTTLLYRAIIDCCDKLIQLDTKDPTHQEQLNYYTSLLSAQKEGAQKQRARLENPQQIKEARQLLKELSKFVYQQSALKLINEAQTKSYNEQINRLVLQMAVDTHLINARQAQQAGKVRLAIHHYSLARKLLISENAAGGFDKQLLQLDNLLVKLEEKAVATGNIPEKEATSNTPPESVNKEWDQFSEESENWKRKNIYD